jgi:hypothetical protein
MNDLRSQLEQITNTFVSSVLAAMGTAALSDLAEESARVALSVVPTRERVAEAAPAPIAGPVAKPAKRGRRRRASAAEVQAQKDAALAAAKTLKSGFSKGDVMKKSESKVDVGRALSLLVKDGKLTRKGDRRKARYWVK